MIFLGACHLIIGGEFNSTSKMSSVELYNWQTNTFRSIPSLPYDLSGMVGTTLNNGKQLFCGGATTTTVQSKCYTLSNKMWIEVSYLIKFLIIY